MLFTRNFRRSYPQPCENGKDEYGHAVAKIAEKALRQADQVVDGGLSLEGKRYCLRQKNGTLTITNKKNCTEILNLKNGLLEGSLSFEDIEAFEKVNQELK